MRAELPGPLTETVYYILLALHSPLHGYGIMQYVGELSAGRINLGAGTLYGALTALSEKGWIRPLEEDASTRRKVYVVTEVGRAVVSAELERLDELLRNGRRIAERVEREGRE